MAEISGLPEIISSSIFRTVSAYNAFITQALGIFAFRDIWVTTSGNPCVFCRAMETLTLEISVPPGGRFPIPGFSIFEYLRALDLTFVEDPPAHENCQCRRMAILRP